jgi:Fic family protein
MEEARYIPPVPSRLMEYLDNWEKYYHFDRPDPLVQLAVLHAQFEIIHPFLDGNGRLGRMVVPLFLFERKLISRPVFYISAYFERNRDEYIASLRGLSARTPESWSKWIAFFLRATEEQAKDNTRKARAIIDLYADLKTRILELTHSQYAVPLLDCLFDQPIFTSSVFDNRHGMAGKPMVLNMPGKLKQAKVITVLRPGSGRRPQILALSQLLAICEERTRDN